MKIFLNINCYIDSNNFIKEEFYFIKKTYTRFLNCSSLTPIVKEAIEKFLKLSSIRTLKKQDPILTLLISTINSWVCNGYVINDEF